MGNIDARSLVMPAGYYDARFLTSSLRSELAGCPDDGGGRPATRFEQSRLDDITITKTPPSDTTNAGFGDGDGGDATEGSISSHRSDDPGAGKGGTNAQH